MTASPGQRSRTVSSVQTDWGRRIPEFKEKNFTALPDLDSDPGPFSSVRSQREWNLPAVPGPGAGAVFPAAAGKGPWPRFFCRGDGGTLLSLPRASLCRRPSPSLSNVPSAFFFSLKTPQDGKAFRIFAVRQ